MEYYSHHLKKYFQVISVLSLLICELDNFTLKLSYWVILDWYFIKARYIYITLTFSLVPCEKSEIVSFASSVMKKIIVFLTRSRLSLKKLIWCIVFGSESSALFLIESIVIILNFFFNKDNLANNHLWHHLLGQLRSFQMLLYVLASCFSSMYHVIFYSYSWKKISWIVWRALFWNKKTKTPFIPQQLESIK